MSKTLKTFILSTLAAFAFTTYAWADFALTAAPNVLPKNSEFSLARHDVDQRSTTRVLTAQTESDGSLTLNVAEEPGIFVLKLSNGSEITLAAAEGENIHLSLQSGTLSASGSPGTTILQAYETFRKESLARLVYPTRNDIKHAKIRSASESEIIDLTQAEVDAYQNHLHELNDFVIKNAADSMALYGSSLRLDGDYRLAELQSLVERFAKKHGDIAATRSLEKRIQTSLQLAIGNVAPELTAKNLAGETTNLSDYRGRYLLVDFWASWCPPCRLENAHYAKLTQRISNERFEIFAVNLDTNQKVWSRAASRDQADWINVSDLQGWTSPLAATYGVNALPASFLLDPEGRIVAKNLRGSAFDTKLQELGLLSN